MHRTDAANHVANAFSDGPPGTVIDDDWLNGVQETLCVAIEAASITLVKGTHTQLRDAIRTLAATWLVSLANTWAELQSFAKGISVTQSVANSNGGSITGNGTGKGLVVASSGGTNQIVLDCDGYIDVSGATVNGAAPANNKNAIGPANVTKAWASVGSNGAGAVSIPAAWNIASSSIDTTGITLTLGFTLAATANAVVIAGSGNDTAAFVKAWVASTTTIRVQWYDAAGGVLDPSGITAYSAGLQLLAQE